jgi:hypothetical protein
LSERRVRRVGAGLLALAALALAGCGGGRSVLPVTLDAPTLAQPVDVGRFTDDQSAVRGIAAILSRDLGLPVPDAVTVYVYASRDVFQQGLIRDGRVSPVRAAELSDFAVGVGKRRTLLLQHDLGGVRGREWYRLIAHELTHVAQIELAQGEGRADQWLAEGMAEWSAFRVLERLSLDTMANRRRVAMAGVHAQAALQSGHLDLETLGTPRGFTRRHLREGSVATYQLAFLMTDYLIDRDGFDRVLDYFRAFSVTDDRHANFEAAFGQSVDDFEMEILERLTVAG